MATPVTPVAPVAQRNVLSGTLARTAIMTPRPVFEEATEVDETSDPGLELPALGLPMLGRKLWLRFMRKQNRANERGAEASRKIAATIDKRNFRRPKPQKMSTVEKIKAKREAAKLAALAADTARMEARDAEIASLRSGSGTGPMTNFNTPAINAEEKP